VHPLIFDSQTDALVFDLAVIQAVDIGELGEQLTDKTILGIFPQEYQDWRVISTDHHRFLASQDIVIATYRDDVQILNRKTLTSVDVDLGIDTRSVLVLLNKDWCIDQLAYNTVKELEPGDVAKAIDSNKQNVITMHMIDYMDMLFKVRGIKVNDLGELYAPSKTRRFVYERVDLGSGDSKDKLVSWLTGEIERHGPPLYRELLRGWAPDKFTGFERKLQTYVGNRVGEIKPEWCYAFKNGIWYMPGEITQENANVNSWFMTEAEMLAAGKPVVQPIREFDIDFNPAWATDPDGFPAMNKIFATQQWNREYIDLVLAVVYGRSILKWTLAANNKHDRWEVNVILHGKAGAGKSTVLKALTASFPSGTVQELASRGSPLACKQHLLDSHPCRLITARDMNTLSISFFANEFTHSDFRQLASGEPLGVSIMRGVQVSQILTSCMVVAQNNLVVGWLMADRSQAVIESVIRRIFSVYFKYAPAVADDTLENSAMSDEELAPLLCYSMRCYSDMLVAGIDKAYIDSHPVVKANREAILVESSPLYSYLRHCIGGGSRHNQDVPLIHKSPGDYITPTELRRAVRIYASKELNGFKQIEMFSPEEIRNAVSKTMVEPADKIEVAVRTPSDFVQSPMIYYCGDCHDDKAFIRRSQCKHANSSRAERSKRVPAGSLLNAKLDINVGSDDGHMFV
jgi:hypothetical protein